MNTLVVKIGGGAGLDVQATCADLAVVARERRLVIVHGVSAIMNQLCKDLGVPVQTLTSPDGHSSRYTNAQTRDIFVQAAEHANREIVEYLWSHNINALHVLGERAVIHGTRKQAIKAVVDGRIRMVRDDYSGTISRIDNQHINELLDLGYVPVIPPIATSPDGLLNVDGDRASAAVAASLNAEELIILSNVRGLFRDFPNEASFVDQIGYQHIEDALDWAQGRMKRKIIGAREALAGGVRRVVISDGRVGNPVSQALAGQGTVFTC